MAEITKPNFNNGLWASGGAIVAPSNVKIATGWTAEVPPFQWENYSQNRQDQGIAHILQHGISVWDALTEYQADRSYVQGSDGLLYKARTTHINVNPVTDTSFVNWTKAMSGGLLNVRVFSTAGTFTYTPTPGTTSVVVEVQAGGAGSGGLPASIAAGAAFTPSGGAGAYGKSRYTSGFSGVTITVGSGGTAGATGGGGGGNGGASSFGGLLSAPGGIGGIGGSSTTTFPNNSNYAADTALPSGANIEGSRGVGGSQVLMASFSFGNGFNAPSLSRFGAGPGSGAAGKYVGPNVAASAGTAGQPGIVIVWEYC